MKAHCTLLSFNDGVEKGGGVAIVDISWESGCRIVQSFALLESQ